MDKIIKNNKGLSIFGILILLVFGYFLYIVITRPKPAPIEKKKDFFSEQGIDRPSKDAVINSTVNKYREVEERRFKVIDDLQNY